MIEDTKSIQSLVNQPFATSENADFDLLKILLQRPLRHCAAVALRFFATHGQSIETSVWKNSFLDPITKVIVEHVVLSATDIVRRDVLILINNTMCRAHPERTANEIRIGIKFCRLHWFPDHLKKVRQEFKRYVGFDLEPEIESINARDTFSKVMTALSRERERFLVQSCKV